MGIARRAQGATTKAIPVWIVEEEQRRDRPQDPCALRVAAAGGRLLRCGGSTMCTDIACAAAPCIRPPGARNAAICTFTTDCESSGKEEVQGMDQVSAHLPPVDDGVEHSVLEQ